MKQLKKTLLTLVALLAVTTGAWADETPLLTIESKDYTSFKSGSKTFDDKVTVTFSNSVYNDGDEDGWYTDVTASLLTVAGINGYTITSCKFYTVEGDAQTGYTVEGESPSVYLSASREVYTDANESMSIGEPGITKIEVFGTAPAASTGPEVTWTAATKTGQFTMPGGNVTLEPDYYPQATAEGAVTAATDAKATTDAPLVTIDETKLTGAKKLMYYVSTDATAPAYDAEGWTDVLPTAENYTEAATLYVWYYPVGTDEGTDEATATYSDGDICATALTVTLGAAPTYAVTLNAEGLSTDEAAAWKVAKGTDQPAAFPLEGVTKGTAVTVTYTGSKKVIGVKAEKKAAAPAETTVTLTTGEIGDLTSWGSNSKTINGITIAVSGDAHFFTTGYMEVSAYDGETGDPIPTTGTYTFTSSVGKIKRIDINHNSGKWWGSGDGWPGSYNVSHSSTFTWSGTPAASVTLYGSCNEDDQCAFDVSSFVFTIEPAN